MTHDIVLDVRHMLDNSSLIGY